MHTNEEMKAAEKTFWAWVDSISSRRAENVVHLYRPDAVLIPTLTPDILDTQTQRTIYFHALVIRDHMRVKVGQVKIALLGPEMFGATGLYTFMYQEEGREEEILARFSMVLKKGQDGEYQIIQHHSSRLPPMPPPPLPLPLED